MKDLPAALIGTSRTKLVNGGAGPSSQFGGFSTFHLAVHGELAERSAALATYAPIPERRAR